MTTHFSKAGLFAPVALLLVLAGGCKKSTSTGPNTPPPAATHPTGWAGTDDPTKVPAAVNISSLVGTSPTLPSKVDLTPFLPPIGDQGQTETCVAWATAYYSKTASQAIAFNYDQSKLVNAAYQLSPKDMFLSIPDNQKGADCQSGTNITYALDVMVANGVASEATVPWDGGITNCSISQVQNAWNTDAANHKIEYYRTIPATVQGIKEQLANKNPIMIGIKVSNEYQAWRNADVLTTATFPSPVGLHAQTIVGYDDSKGPAGAFRIANSWNTNWGDNGFIWIDYNTLVNQYIADGNAYYMATSSSDNNVTPPAPPTTPTTNAVDMAAWVFSDVSTASTTGVADSRTMYLNIYNLGENAASPTSNWGYYYLYYNAFNANDYGVIFHDQFNTTIATNTYSCATNDACIFNISLPGGSNFADEAFGDPSFYRSYNVPNITGLYYLVLVVDPENKLSDVNRQNNIFYTTGQLPALFSHGVANSYSPHSGAVHDDIKNDLQINPKNLAHSQFNTSVGRENRNAYTPGEILGLVKAKYEKGEIQQKIKAMQSVKKIKLDQLHKN